MDPISIELVNALVQYGGAPAVIGILFFFLWKYGPGRDFQRLVDDVHEIKTDIKHERDKTITRLGEHHRRIERLEIIADVVAREKTV